MSDEPVPFAAPGPAEVETAPASVLIVDDSAVGRRTLAKAMAALGHAAETAPDGAAAMRLLRERAFDVVLLDIVMPGIDGYDVLAAMREDPELRDVPVIVVSSLDDEIGSVAKAIEMGAEDFLPKNFERAILEARLNASLARKRFRDRERAYLRDIERLTRAAEVIEAGAFRPADLGVDDVAARRDPLGRLASVFRGLAQEVYERERRLDQTVRTLRGTLLVVAAGGVFGVAPALGRITAELGAPPLGVVVWSNAAGAALCLAFAAARGRLTLPRRRDLGFLMLWALLLGCLYQSLTVLIAGHVEASMIALVGSSRGFMVFLLAALLALEAPSLRRFAGLGVGFAAVAAVLLARRSGVEEDDAAWLAASLVLPLLLAGHTLLMAWRPSRMDAFATVGFMMALSAAFLAPIAAGTGSMFLPSPRMGELELVTVALGAATALALALALDLVRVAGPVFAGQMAYSQTLAGIAWGMLLLDERLSPVAWAAFALVFAGFWLVEPKRAGEDFRATAAFARRAGRAAGPSRRAAD
ncbi:MAG: response regulator [Paracoccaceae bacterium]